MLYEVITLQAVAQVGQRLGMALAHVAVFGVGGQGEGVLRVITSYSIHYTKLYEGWQGRIVLTERKKKAKKAVGNLQCKCLLQFSYRATWATMRALLESE